MDFLKHSNLAGKHAMFPASSPAWLRYDDEKLIKSFINRKAAEIGTKKHEWAKMSIDLGIRQPKTKNTLYMYVNDGIGFQMNTEVPLYYSDNFFGTADAICFHNNFLRIHDLKTGTGPVHPEQLYIYAALFCLEYRIKPGTIKIELRIYQNDEVSVMKPTTPEIVKIMDIIVKFDKKISKLDR